MFGLGLSVSFLIGFGQEFSFGCIPNPKSKNWFDKRTRGVRSTVAPYKIILANAYLPQETHAVDKYTKIEGKPPPAEKSQQPSDRECARNQTWTHKTKHSHSCNIKESIQTPKTYWNINLHALTKFGLCAGFVLVPPLSEPSLDLSDIPV